MKHEWGNLIIEKRFGMRQKAKPKIQRDSITEYGGVDRLRERLTIQNMHVSAGRPASAQDDEEEVDNAALVAEELISELDMSLTVPPRVPHDGMDRELFRSVENRVFDEWRRRQTCSIFERNIEIWRQFWITCERSDVIVQIVDARNPEFFVNDDIRMLYPEKEHILLINKADISQTRCAVEGYRCIYYSALDGNSLSELVSGLENVAVGFIGYPNVGKSSTINLITKQKKVRVSQTPGKTKYIQTIPLKNGVCLLDCPGLVFPRHSKIDLILHGILNVDQLIDLNSNLDYIVDFVGATKLCRHYSVRTFYNDSRQSKGTNFINSVSMEKGWERSRCLKNVVKDFVAGHISYERTSDCSEAQFDWYEKETFA